VVPERIGRYRVLRFLGSGGMGEVFEAYDDRLQRPVAIKGLHHDRVSPDRRERLRREALSTAALSHPAITHTYEILTEADTDWVVMEFVEGTSLADVLSKGPPSPAEVAGIGAEIAEALAEAHRRGIVHRDIKTENVMLTPAGHVKVLDFGLAKWVGVRAASDDRITTDGIVVGTSKAMSPEQALGKEVDSRSDIFSLGSTLYELATGKPAFRGTTPIETMHKVARCECEPLAEVSPDLPNALVSVIERCMARDPGDRYQTADELVRDLRRVAASATDATEAAPAVRSSQVFVRVRSHWLAGLGIVAALAVAAAVAVKQGWLSPRKPLTVAVLPVQSPASDDSARLASTAIEDAIVTGLARLKNVIVVSGRDARAVASQGKRVPEIARELGVRELVETSLTAGQAGQPIRVDLQRLDGQTGQVSWSEQLEVGTDDLMLLQDRVVTALGDAFRGMPTSGHPGSQDATPAALKAYLQAKSRIDSGKYSKDFKEEIVLLETAIAEAPRFLAPVFSLATTYRYLHDLYRRPADEDRFLALAKRARDLASDHPWVLSLEVWRALDRRDNDDALEKARAWTASRPGDSTAWETMAVVLGRMERHREAETAFERSLALLPAWYTLHALAQSRENRGDFDGAREAIRRALAISPGNLFVLGLLAEVEMYAGNNPEAERLYRDLLARRGTRLDRIHLGNCLYYQSKLAEAAALYREAADKDPTDYLALGNLADTELAMDQTAPARADYAGALRLCETEYAQGLRRRSLLETRARCLAQLGHGPEAFLAVQEALADYPDNPATMFMAALVAAVAGDTNACLAWTGKALAAHAPVVWFTGPEFAPLARDPRFQALTSRG
jgi:tetratricopeptide (TPR) repeat protein/TolB-like protein